MKHLALLLASLAATVTASAQTATWEGLGAETGTGRYWGNLANWSGVAAVPNGAAATVATNNDFINSGAMRTLLLANASGVDASFTVGTLQYSNSTSGNRNYTISNVSGGSGTLIFDSGSPSATAKLTVYTGGTNQQTINVPVQLNSNLEISIGAPAATTNNLVVINGSIRGTGGLVASTAAGNLYRIAFTGANTYTGATVIERGHFVVSGAGTLGQSDTTVGANGTLTLGSATSLNDSFGLLLLAGSTVNLGFTGSDSISSLTIAGNSIAAGTYDVSALNGFAQTYTSANIFAGTGSLTIIPESASTGILVGMAILGACGLRRRRCRA